MYPSSNYVHYAQLQPTTYINSDSRRKLFNTQIIIIIGILLLARFGQRPELRQATGVALGRCIMGKFLGVGCHYFPPLR
jgi:hypothetical protein